jgi:hypothetical protein
MVTLSAVLWALFSLSPVGNRADAQQCCGQHNVVGASASSVDGVSTCSEGEGSGSYEHIPPQRCGMVAPSYPVPHEVPYRVGRTHFTYPPVMPHHSLPHYRKVYSYRHGPGLCRTTVKWRPPYVCSLLKRLHYIIELPR